MDIPRRGINQRKIGDLDVFGVHKFYKVRPSVLKLSLVKFIPPNLALAINGSVVAWETKRKRAHHQQEYGMKQTCFLYHSQIQKLLHIFVISTCYNNVSEVGSKNKTDISSACCISSPAIWWQRIYNIPLALFLKQIQWHYSYKYIELASSNNITVTSTLNWPRLTTFYGTESYRA